MNAHFGQLIWHNIKRTSINGQVKHFVKLIHTGDLWRIQDFQKIGAKFCWPLVLAQKGETVFSIFSCGAKHKILAKGGHGPPKYATAGDL